jgi:two-component system response regulator
MPKKDGFAVLSEIRKDPEIAHIPIVMLTTSAAEQDIIRCYKLHANAYVIKPDSLPEFSLTIRAIEEFWFRVAQLPLGCCN